MEGNDRYESFRETLGDATLEATCEKSVEQPEATGENEGSQGWKPTALTVEPVLSLFLLASGLQWPAIHGLVYSKVCLSRYDLNVCQHLAEGNLTWEQDYVQSEAALWFLWHSYGFEVPTIIMSFVYGAMSDNFSRRAIIALPAVGQILNLISFSLNAVYMDLHVGYTLIGVGISGLTGGWITLFLSCFSYLGEVTEPELRSHRVVIAEGSSSLCLAVALFASDFIRARTGYTFVFAMSIVIYSVCLIYVGVYLREPPPKSQPPEQTGGSKYVRAFHHLKGALLSVFKEREGNNRRRLVATLLIVFTSMTSLSALRRVGYLFVKRSPLNWSQRFYGYFTAVNSIVAALSLLLVVPVLRSKCRLKDTHLAGLGLASACLAEIWFSVSRVTWMVLVTPLVGCLRTSMTVLRATVTQFVQPNELGQTYAALGALQSLSGMVGNTIFNTVYPYSLGFWSGFSFIVGTVMALIPCFLIIWLHHDMAKTDDYTNPTELDVEKIPIMNIRNTSEDETEAR